LQGYDKADRARMGMVLATTKGDIERLVQWMRAADGKEGASLGPVPTLGQEAGRIALEAGLGGPAWVVSTACTSGLVALIDAAIGVLDGEAARMATVGVDVVGGFVRDGFAALKSVSPTTCRPFDRERDGLMLGSAAAACVVARHSKRALCTVSGWGVSNDATHMTAPDRHAGGLVRAMQQALAMAGLAASDIDVLFAHGTGTRYNDAMEAVAIEEVFLKEGSSPAVTAIKGLIGHSLGAASLTETALCALILQRQTVGAITGLRVPERADIDFVLAPRQMKVRHVMKAASGFGGMNAVVILSRNPHA